MTIPPFLVVVAGEHPATRIAVASALAVDASADVVVVDDIALLEGVVEERMPDVVVADAALVADGLELVQRLRAIAPRIGFVVQTTQPSLQDTVLALRARVDEFFPHHPGEDELRRAVHDLASRVQRQRRADGGRVVLAVGARAGDVEMGVGGALLTHVAAGDTVVLLAMTNDGEEAVRLARRTAAVEAAAALGARLVFEDLVPSDLTAEGAQAVVERVVAAEEPTIVYTHSASDQDALHRLVHDAVVRAAPEAQRVAAFQSHASTIDFAPTSFVDVDDVLDRKVEVLEAYAGIADDSARLQPETAVSGARYWSRFGGARRSEPLELVRDAGELAAEAAAPVEQRSAAMH